MTMASRGISDIQEQARGKTMKKEASKGGKKDARKEAAPKNAKTQSAKMKVNVGDITSAGKMPPDGTFPGYKKGGSIDGCAVKGKTRGKIV